MILRNGTRVALRTGRTGAIVKRLNTSRGYRIRWDVREHGWSPAESDVAAVNLYPIHPATRAEFDAAWPSFVQRDRARHAPNLEGVR